MIEVSIFYVLGGLVMLPSTTFLLTRIYYTKMIHKYERKLWVYENINVNMDVNKLINNIEERSKSFAQKQQIISDFLQSKSKDNKNIVVRSNIVQEMKNKFDQN
tara:strand:+ start:341 stop:652 length:312 start_codon:yes stop_codon:yes gene_type:complete